MTRARPLVFKLLSVCISHTEFVTFKKQFVMYLFSSAISSGSNTNTGNFLGTFFLILRLKLSISVPAPLILKSVKEISEKFYLFQHT